MDVQQIIVLLIVVVAAVFLARRLWRDWRGQGGSSCAGCAGACGKPHTANSHVRPAPKATPLVTLSAGAPRRRPVAPTPDTQV